MKKKMVWICKAKDLLGRKIDNDNDTTIGSILDAVNKKQVLFRIMDGVVTIV
jgi:hypothetical protein